MSTYWQIAVDAALGNIAPAQAMWETARPAHEAMRSDPNRGADRHDFREIGEALTANDRVALARILHGIESERIAGGPLEPYWESVPFPLEFRS